MIRNCVCLLLFACSYSVGYAQNLEFLPALTGKGNIKDSSTSFIFNTLNQSRQDPETRTPYLNSVQIVDADVPWPPRWYTPGPYVSESDRKQSEANGVMNADFLLDAKVEHGYLSFFKSVFNINGNDSVLSKSVVGYILLNKKYEPVDTVVSILPNGSLYWHTFRINKQGERLISVKITVKLDLRSKTGNPADSAVASEVDVIEVINKDNSINYSWNSVEKLDPTVFQFNESLHFKSFVQNAPKADSGDLIDWSHLTSAIWDYDGNILYSLRFIGIGKISRKDGSVMWHVDYKDLPVVNGQDSLQWFFPHDFNFISETDSTVRYSLFSLGERSVPNSKAEGVIFDVNKKTNKLKLVRYVEPELRYVGSGQGNFEFEDTANYIFSFGVYNQQDKSPDDKVQLQYTKAGLTTLYKTPAHILIFKTHILRDWVRPARPKIVYRSGTLTVEGSWKDLVWYRLDGPNLQTATVQGKGRSIVPKQGITYCVESPLGIGYVVSRPYQVTINVPY